jgi:protein arginine kinase activator
MSYRDFIQQGVFGCEECYNMFEPLIRENIRKIQGHDEHVGKKPLYNPEMSILKQGHMDLAPEDRINILKERLKEALKAEDYDAAARIRDEVRAIQERDEINA